jgi:hypothetical protein
MKRLLKNKISAAFFTMKYLRHPGLDPGSHSLGDYGSEPAMTNDLENHFAYLYIYIIPDQTRDPKASEIAGRSPQ